MLKISITRFIIRRSFNTQVIDLYVFLTDLVSYYLQAPMYSGCDRKSVLYVTGHTVADIMGINFEDR